MTATAGDCFKYLYRAGKKDNIAQDLGKAKWYAERSQQNGYGVWHPNAPEHINDMLKMVAMSRTGNIRYAMEGIAAAYHGTWSNLGQ